LEITMTAPVEAKVRAASAGSVLAGIAIAVLNAITTDSSLLGPLPAWLQAPILAVVPFAVTFLAGYQAPHNPRPDQGA
jgi:hypothetical protein